MPPVDHIITIVMENEEFSKATFLSEAPFLWSLGNPDGTGTYGFLSNYFAVTHPSLPNYLALTGGSTFGVSTDCQPNECPQDESSIATLLDNRGLSWREYAESMPAPCWAEISGEYYPKHNPFVYYAGVSSDKSYCASHVVPLGDVSSETGPFFDDLRRNELPSYSFITPNICDDAHDCPLSTGDAWLKSFIQKIVNNDSVFQKSIIFICFDEGTTNAGFGQNVAGGQIYGAVIGPSNIVRPGSISSVYYSHYSILATVEKIFDLGSLGRNDKTANTIGSDIFTF